MNKTDSNIFKEDNAPPKGRDSILSIFKVFGSKEDQDLKKKCRESKDQYVNYTKLYLNTEIEKIKTKKSKK
jgi:hypothetical protein